MKIDKLTSPLLKFNLISDAEFNFTTEIKKVHLTFAVEGSISSHLFHTETGLHANEIQMTTSLLFPSLSISHKVKHPKFKKNIF